MLDATALLEKSVEPKIALKSVKLYVFIVRETFMRLIFATTILLILSACNKVEDNPSTPPVANIAPQPAELQKAKALEKQTQIDAENQRKVIQVQTK